MSDILETKVELINDRMKYSGRAGNNPPIITDYIPPLGDKEGYMPLELFLISISSCLGGSIAPFLRRMGKSINKLTINTQGIRKTEHPTGFSKIIFDIFISSNNISPEDMERTIKLAEDKYCPIISMIKGNVDIEIKYNLI